MVTVDEAVSALNTMLEADPEAMTKLVHRRVPCNERLADHPTCQVGGGEDGPWVVGLLGILNGIFGRENGAGHIAALIDPDVLTQRLGEEPKPSVGRVVRFVRNG